MQVESCECAWLFQHCSASHSYSFSSSLISLRGNANFSSPDLQDFSHFGPQNTSQSMPLRITVNRFVIQMLLDLRCQSANSVSAVYFNEYSLTSVMVMGAYSQFYLFVKETKS